MIIFAPEEAEIFKDDHINRCELLGFIREINSGIFTCEKISFFPPELLLHNYKCSGYVPCCVTVNTHVRL